VTSIQSIIQELEDSNESVPQPEGKEAADLYKDGTLDHATCLHVIAVLLRKIRDMEEEAEDRALEAREEYPEA
jgi:hypothetical protein